MNVRRGAVVLLLVLAAGPVAAVAAEGESSLAIIPGYASFSLTQGKDPRSGMGATVALDYQHAVNDTFWVRASVAGALYDVDGGGGAQAGVGLVGITYAIDVLKYVPYATLMIGGGYFTGDRVDGQLRGLLEIGVGLDVLQSPHWSFGLDARFEAFVTDANVFTIGPHLTYRWGYF